MSGSQTISDRSSLPGCSSSIVVRPPTVNVNVVDLDVGGTRAHHCADADRSAQICKWLRSAHQLLRTRKRCCLPVGGQPVVVVAPLPPIGLRDDLVADLASYRGPTAWCVDWVTMIIADRGGRSTASSGLVHLAFESHAGVSRRPCRRAVVSAGRRSTSLVNTRCQGDLLRALAVAGGERIGLTDCGRSALRSCDPAFRLDVRPVEVEGEAGA